MLHAWAAVVLLAVVLGLLLVPVEVAFAAGTHPARAEVRLRWLYGLVDRRVTPGEGGTRAADEEEAPEPATAPASKAPARSPVERWPQVRRVLAVDGLKDAFTRLMGRLWRSIHLLRLRLEGVYGTGDPAETGRLHGILASGLAAVPRRRDVVVQVTPDFLETRLQGNADGALRVRPLRVLAAVVAFAATPAVVRAAVRAWRTPT